MEYGLIMLKYYRQCVVLFSLLLSCMIYVKSDDHTLILRLKVLGDLVFYVQYTHKRYKASRMTTIFLRRWQKYKITTCNKNTEIQQVRLQQYKDS